MSKPTMEDVRAHAEAIYNFLQHQETEGIPNAPLEVILPKKDYRKLLLKMSRNAPEIYVNMRLGAISERVAVMRYLKKMMDES